MNYWMMGAIFFGALTAICTYKSGVLDSNNSSDEITKRIDESATKILQELGGDVEMTQELLRLRMKDAYGIERSELSDNLVEKVISELPERHANLNKIEQSSGDMVTQLRLVWEPIAHPMIAAYNKRVVELQANGLIVTAEVIKPKELIAEECKTGNNRHSISLSKDVSISLGVSCGVVEHGALVSDAGIRLKLNISRNGRSVYQNPLFWLRMAYRYDRFEGNAFIEHKESVSLARDGFSTDSAYVDELHAHFNTTLDRLVSEAIVEATNN